MTNAYVDSSAILAIVLGEPGAPAASRRLARFESLYTANLTEAEVRAALAREGVDDKTVPGSLFAPLGWILPTRPLSSEIERALKAGFLRGADLWHVACALYLEPEPDELVFLTLDANQRSVARKLGFPV